MSKRLLLRNNQHLGFLKEVQELRAMEMYFVVGIALVIQQRFLVAVHFTNSP